MCSGIVVVTISTHPRATLMAKKKSEAKDVPTVASTKPVRLELPPDMHRLLRLAAANAEVSMASYVRDIVEAHLKAKKPKGGE